VGVAFLNKISGVVGRDSNMSDVDVTGLAGVYNSVLLTPVGLVAVAT